MKKISAIFMTVIMISALFSLSSSATKSETPAQCIVSLTENRNSDYLSVSIKLNDVSKYKSIWAEIEYNKDVLEYNQTSVPVYKMYSQTITRTETGVRYLASYNEDYADRRSALVLGRPAETTISFLIKNSGATQLSVTAYAQTSDVHTIALSVDSSGLPEEIQAEEYGAAVTFPEVVYYDKNASDYNNQIYVPVEIKNIAKIKNGSVTLSFNPDVLDFETAEFTEDMLYSKEFTETDNSITFKAAFIDLYNDRTNAALFNISATVTLIFNIKGTGNMGITASSAVSMPDDSTFAANVEINGFYPDAVDVSEVELLSPNGAFNNIATSRFILDRTMTVSRMRRYYSANISVLDKHGNKVGENALIPTNSMIVSTYNGYIVNEQLVTVLGDVNCDGSVNAADARIVLRISAKLEKAGGWLELEAADCNGKTGVTAADARKILRVAAKTETMTPTTIELETGEEYEIGPLENAGSGSYNWVCTLSDEAGMTVSESVTPPKYSEINPGTPFEHHFTLKANTTGTYTAHFELLCPWNKDIADSFDLVFVVK